MTEPVATEAFRLLRLPQVLALVPLSRSEWYRRVGTGQAPAPVKLGTRIVAWRARDIQDYVARLGDNAA